MATVCCVFYCTAHKIKNPELSFYVIPKVVIVVLSSTLTSHDSIGDKIEQ